MLPISCKCNPIVSWYFFFWGRLLLNLIIPPIAQQHTIMHASFLLFHLIRHFESTLAHSFVECVDYDGEITGLDYEDSLCNGYARNWDAFTHLDWGDTGNKQNRLDTQTTKDLCKFDRNSLSEDYSDSRPMATYTVGETVRIIWPAKNHAMYECFAFRKDYGLQLYIDPNGYDSNTQDSNTLSDWTMVIDWHEPYAAEFASISPKGITGVPFQNCPAFCENTDLAPCFG